MSNLIGNKNARILVVLLLQSLHIYAQEVNQSINGTIVYGAVTKEGVTFVADSRVGFNDDGIRIFYVDGIKKLFVHNNFIIAYSGSSHISKTPINSFFYKMDNHFVDSPEDWIRKFLIILKREYAKDEIIDVLKKVSIVVGGFNKSGVPSLAGLQNHRILTANEGIITNHKDIAKSDSLEKFDNEEAVAIMKSEIRNFIVDNNSFSDIGGKFSVITINRSREVKIAESSNNLNFRTVRLFRDYFLVHPEMIHPLDTFSLKNIFEILVK